LCGPVGARDHWAIAVKREAHGRGGSRSMADDVNEGDELPLRGGDNMFPIDPQAQQHILIAGGIGLTPLYAMALTLAQTPTARFHLYVCSRDAEGTAFLSDLQQAPWREEVTEVLPACHGNALSIYARGPEGNRLELFIDTPWYVNQPLRESFGFDQSDEDIWHWAHEMAKPLPGYRPREQWVTEMKQKMGVH
jgi:ferredoxin-NADP reductase